MIRSKGSPLKFFRFVILLLILFTLFACSRPEEIRIESKSQEPNLLFHMNGYPDSVPAGESIVYNESITNLILKTNVTATIKVTIRLKDSSKSIFTNEESVSIEDSLIRQKQIPIPDKTAVGSYVLEQMVSYGDKAENEMFYFDISKATKKPETKKEVSKTATEPEKTVTKKVTDSLAQATAKNTSIQNTSKKVSAESAKEANNPLPPPEPNLKTDNVTYGISGTADNPVFNVVIANWSYIPSIISVKINTTVTWINLDSSSHTASGPGFDSGPLGMNKKFFKKFTKPLKNATYSSSISDLWGIIEVRE